MKRWFVWGGISAIMMLLLLWSPVGAQDRGQATIAEPGSEGKTIWPLSPRDRGAVAEGLPVSPALEGWYPNRDGTYTLVFGFLNRNQEETLVIPIGPDNFIQPTAYDGGQPTVFPAREWRGYSHGSSTGVFTVTVPGDFAESGGEIVWTLRSHGFTYSVPGRVVSETYQLSLGPQAMGSLPPMLKLEEDGPELWGSFTADGDPREASTSRGLGGGNVPGSYENPIGRSATVGVPLTLTAWAEDRLEEPAERAPVIAGVTWFTHQGPAPAQFHENEQDVDEAGQVTTRVSFSEPGTYLLRVRADNFNPEDSSPGDQCCWTNGYIRVNVSD